ncbi:MAG: NAD-dependent epimerase/dehydratase family protein [Acidimicrobiales bacterium]|nr:NAD-dependent epimerase/dehydratase family protein [Acidimicrobiales bacterium]
MHVLVTGGHGLIGHGVSERLIAAGHDVTVVELPRFGVPERVARPDAYRLIEADILDVAEWGPVLADVDAVVHTAGIHQVDEVARDAVRHIDVNVTGTHKLLTAAHEHGVGRFVYLSSAKVYGHAYGRASRESDLVAPLESYALGKVVAEHYCAHFANELGMATCSIRPFSVYGPGQDTHTGYIGALLESLRRGQRVVLSGDPEFVRDFVHIDTVVDLCVSAVTSEKTPPLLLNAGSGEATTLAQLVKAFETVTERTLRVSYRDPRPGTLRFTLADTDVMREFDAPHMPDLEQGILETVTAELGAP